MGIEFDNVVRDLDYYRREPSLTEPTFQGKGSRLMGIEGQWDDTQFRRLYEGQNPHDGERLDGIRMVKNRRGAWDVTFNRDKATSILKLVGDDTRIAEVEDRAIAKAMKSLESQVRVRVRKQSELMASKAKMPKGWKHPERISGNLVWVKFDHPASREGDPHSHSHIIVMAVSYDRQEGRWKSPELRYLDRAAISDVYHEELARGMRKLGYKARWDGKELSVHGVQKEVRAEFSQRNAAIKAKEAEYDKRAEEAGRQLMSSKKRQKVGLFNRPEKDAAASLVDRRQGWLGRLSDAQRNVLDGLVRRAKSALKHDRWRDGLKRHADRLRSFVRTQEPEHGRERGRGR